MSEIRRYTTALILVAALMLLLEFGGFAVFSIIVTLVSIISLYELKTLFKNLEVDLSLAPVMLCGVGACYGFYSGRIWLVLLSYFLCVIIVSVLKMVFYKGPMNSVYSVVFSLFSIVYITFPVGCLINIRRIDGGLSFIYILLMATWASDTGAYLAGKKFGRRKLAPLISPNKTIEGLMGGILLTIAAFLIWWGIGIIALWQAVIFGIAISVSATAGDLLESIIKRGVGVKDSGSIFPGHGGILDRIDALLFTAPVWYICIIFLR
ncbi:MAG: phosphatidate cytidylyltransferase [Candidatus Schekmanbacteria bacterium]|nr:phosphatidate cytidylyltransferase [Candidatus Schekmanbacteria bacterium]